MVRNLFLTMQMLFVVSQLLFMVAKKLEIKVTPSLNRIKDFLLENHRFEFSRADPILCETVRGKNPPGIEPPLLQTLNLTLSLT